MDKELRRPFIASIILHSVLIINLPFFLPRLIPENSHIIEVNYYKQEEGALPNYEKTKEGAGQNAALDQNIVLKNIMKLPQPFVMTKDTSQPDFIREDFFAKKKLEQKKLILPKQDLMKKRVTLPLMESSGIRNPVYLSYFNSLRVKIRRFAYKNYDRFEEGAVYLTFVINSDGKLQEARVVAGKSTGSSLLKEIALNSIKEASPYPPFPKNLDYPQLTFNVIISFELNQK